MSKNSYPNLEKHWVKDKERFSAYAISYAENNKILEDFKSIYWTLVTEHPELTAKQVADYYRSNFTTHEAQPKEKVSEWSVEEYKNSVEKYLETVILREVRTSPALTLWRFHIIMGSAPRTVKCLLLCL